MKKHKNILVYRLGSLGDTIVALPCLHLVARAFPDRKRILLTNAPVHAKAPAASAVLGESELIHEYISYPVGTRNIFELAKLCWKVRRLKIEIMVYLTAPRSDAALRRDEIFFRLCGIREIIGIPRGELGTHYYDQRSDRYEAEASRLARCVTPIGDARLGDQSSWDLRLTPNEQARASAALQPLGGVPFLALGIASKQSVTDWGIENWKALMPRLHANFPGHSVVFIGAKEDYPAVEDTASRWPGMSLNLSGKLTPRESAAVIRRAELYLGLDSGPVHLAASVGTPCVSVSAGNKLPGTWFPYGGAHEVVHHKTECRGCNLEVCTVENKKCILSISVEEVVAGAVRAYQRSYPGRRPENIPSAPLRQYGTLTTSVLN